jgi:hypothetical protein
MLFVICWLLLVLMCLCVAQLCDCLQALAQLWLT